MNFDSGDGERRYWAYVRRICSSIVVTRLGSRPERPSCSRSSRVNAVPRFAIGWTRISRPRALIRRTASLDVVSRSNSRCRMDPILLLTASSGFRVRYFSKS